MVSKSPFERDVSHVKSFAGATPVTPDPESSFLGLCAQLDWDPRSEVQTDVGEEVHGRYVHRFPSHWLREIDRHF